MVKLVSSNRSVPSSPVTLEKGYYDVIKSLTVNVCLDGDIPIVNKLLGALPLRNSLAYST